MRYLVINFYSPLNLGDLAILEQTLWVIMQADPRATFDVCVSDDAFLPDLPRVRWVRNWNFVLRGPNRTHAFMALRAAHARADLILSLGGGYFFVHDHRPASAWATLALAYALRWRKPVICLPQSFGPFRHAYQARLAARLMARCAQVMLRDPESLALYAHHAPPAHQAQHVPDVAFTLALRWPGQPDAKPWPPRVGATVVDWSPVDPQLRSAQARYERGMADLLAHAVARLGAEVRLFVQCQSRRRRFESDLAASQRVWAQARQALPADLAERVQIVDDLRRPEQAAVAYGQMSTFIATRLHSAIIAASQGTPVLAIGYQPKTLAAMRLLGQAEYSFDLRALPADLAARLDALWAARVRLGTQAAQAAQRLGRASADALQRTIAAHLSR